MIPPILTDEEAEALSRGWRRIRSGWEIPTLLLLPVAPGPGGTWRAASSPLHGSYNFTGSEADCLRVDRNNTALCLPMEGGPIFTIALTYLEVTPGTDAADVRAMAATAARELEEIRNA